MMQRPLDFGETLYYTRNLSLGNHGVFFYRSSSEKHEVVFNFFQAGLEKGEGVVYVASQETAKQIRRQMTTFGLDVDTVEKDGALKIFDYDNWYIIDGEVNVPHIITRGSRLFDEAMEIGLTGLRGCGETACFFEHAKQKELVEYELMIGRKFDLPMTALCAYDADHAKSLDDISFFNLLHAHGPVITHSFAQEVLFEDLFATITDEVLETIFRNSGKKTIMQMLGERRPLTSEEITQQPRVFFEGLEEVVGSGAQIVAKAILKKMYAKIGIA